MIDLAYTSVVHIDTIKCMLSSRFTKPDYLKNVRCIFFLNYVKVLPVSRKLKKSSDFTFAGFERKMNSEHGKILCFCLSKNLFFWWKMSLLFKSFLRFTNYLVRKQSFDHLAKLASPLTFTCLTPPKKH